MQQLQIPDVWTVHISDRPYFTWASIWWTSIKKKIALDSLKISYKKLNIQNDSIIEEKTTFLLRKLVAHTHTHAYTTNE